MAKISANYEVVYIIDPAQGEEAIAATVAKFQTLAEQNGSDVVVDEWGKRRLAYAIDYKTEGYYVLMSFTSAPEFPKELDRILGITEGIMRSMIVCKDEYGRHANAEQDFYHGTFDPRSGAAQNCQLHPRNQLLAGGGSGFQVPKRRKEHGFHRCGRLAQHR